MLQFLKTWRRFVFAALLLLFSSLIWISNSREEKDRNFIDRTVVTITSPFQSAISWVLGGVKHVWYGYLYFVGLQRSNDALRKENDVLRGQLAEDWETQSENDRLRSMLAFEKENPGQLVAATVIGADSASWAKSIRINRGSKAGLGRNMAVVTPSGVLGRVVEVSPWYSDVQLITDGRSDVPVRVQRTRAQGMLEGLSKGICHLKFVQRSEDVEAGDIVITSGLGGIFPRGLVVGTIVDVEKKEYGVLQEVRVVPAVDFQRLPEEVLVVVQSNEPPEAPEVAATPTPKPTAAAAAPAPHVLPAAVHPGTGPDE